MIVPNKPVTVRRWEVVAAFVVVVAAAVIAVQWSNHNIDKRIDAAEKRIRANTATNEQQNEIRRELVAHFKKTDARICMFINALRTENRREAQLDFDSLDADLRLIGIEKTPAIVARATEELTRALNRNQEVDC